MTINQERFNVMVKEAMDKYERAVEAKTPPNKIKHANGVIAQMQKAIQFAEIVGKTEKIPYLWEYITLSEAMVGEMHFELKDFKSSVEWFNKSLESNKKTLGNQETWIRDLYILNQLTKIGIIEGNLQAADEFAQKMVDKTKRVLEVAKKIEYLDICKKVFIESKDLDWINKTYKIMQDLLKKAEGDLRKTKASFCADYGRYLAFVIKKDKQAKELLQEAVELFNEFNMEKEMNAAKEILAQVK